LDLLRDLYREIIIPSAVWDEIVVEGEGQPGSVEVKNADWVKTSVVKNRQLVRALRQELDSGEAEAIVLAVETGDSLLLMDEKLGRDVARHMGVHFVGLIGVLVSAKRRGLLPAIKPLLDDLRNVAGFHVGDDLYTRVLHDASES
jgi:predicted nucleic acid-binding protein